MGRTGRTCGAVTGAYLVIGLAEQSAAKEGLEAVYKGINEFDAKFIGRFNSTECNDLLGYNLSTPEGLACARAEGLFTKICPGFVKGAAEILEESLG